MDSGGVNVHYPEIASALHIIFSLEHFGIIIWYHFTQTLHVLGKLNRHVGQIIKLEFNFQIDIFCDEHGI